jgi:hypothetical protein
MDRLEILPGQRGLRAESTERAALLAGAGHHDEHVGAHGRECRRHHGLGALADRHGGNHGKDADDDAQHRQECAHLAAHQRLPGDEECL